MNMKLPLLKMWLAFVAAIPATAATQTPGRDEAFPDPIVAKGMGFEIPQSLLDESVDGVVAQMVTRGQQLTPDLRLQIQRQVLETLIQTKLLVGRATDADKVRGKELYDKRLGDILARTTEEALNRQLKAIGLTFDIYKLRLMDEAISKTMKGKNILE